MDASLMAFHGVDFDCLDMFQYIEEPTQPDSSLFGVHVGLRWEWTGTVV